MLENREYKILSRRYDTLLIKATNLMQSFEPNGAYYGQEVKHALKRLKVVIKVQNRLTNWPENCWPIGQYSSANHMSTYDMSSIDAMERLSVDTIIPNANGRKRGILMKNISFGEAMERLNTKALRHNQFKTLKRLITKDMTATAHINQMCYDHCKKMEGSLSLLQELIIVVNQGPDWESLCENRGWDGTTILSQYDLNSIESMLTRKITTKETTYHSLRHLLTNIDNIEKAKYLFNELYKQVMPEVYHLQELANTHEQPTIAKLMESRATYITEALQRLYDAIALEYTSIKRLTYNNFSTIEKLLTTRISDKMSLQEAILFTEDNLKIPVTLQRLIPDVLNRMDTDTLDFNRPLGESYTMYDGMQTSIVVAKALCHLTESGDLNQIQAMNPSPDNIDLLIDLPVELQPSSLYKDAMYVYNHPLSLYAGKYNALILAVLYRHTDIVKYFLTKGANPEIKGGRFNDLSAESCVSLALPGMKPVLVELIQLLQEPPVIRRHFGNNINFYKQQPNTNEPSATNNSVCVIC